MIFSQYICLLLLVILNTQFSFFFASGETKCRTLANATLLSIVSERKKFLCNFFEEPCQLTEKIKLENLDVQSHKIEVWKFEQMHIFLFITDMMRSPTP